MNGTLSFYECRLTGLDTQILPAVINLCELFSLHIRSVWESICDEKLDLVRE